MGKKIITLFNKQDAPGHAYCEILNRTIRWRSLQRQARVLQIWMIFWRSFLLKNRFMWSAFSLIRKQEKSSWSANMGSLSQRNTQRKGLLWRQGCRKKSTPELYKKIFWKIRKIPYIVPFAKTRNIMWYFACWRTGDTLIQWTYSVTQSKVDSNDRNISGKNMQEKQINKRKWGH